MARKTARRLILQMQMSVDGFVAAADPGLPWQVWGWGDRWPWDARLKQDFNAVFDAIDCILLSRRMVEQGYLDHWGAAARRFPADPHYAFAQQVVAVEKVVVTNKLEASRWERTRIARGGLAPEVHALKREPGRDILCFGGAGFASALVAEGLVDEYQLFVNPSVVGEGLSIFRQAPQGLRLIGSTAYACGVVVNRYAP